MNELQKLFVFVSADKTAEFKALENKSAYDKKIVFLAGTGEIYAKDTIFGANTAAELSALQDEIDAFEELVGTIPADATATDIVGLIAEKVAAEAGLREDADKAITDRLDIIEGEANVAGSIKKAEADAKAYADGLKAAIEGELAETDAKTLAALNDKIEAVEGAAKSYSLKSVDASSEANVREAWGLFDEDNAQAGSTIKIYKDSSLKSVALDGQILKFTYILADGSEDEVEVDVSAFLHESEYGNGLQVVNHVASVKLDATSEGFLTVGADGIKLAGVQDAIDAAQEAAEGHADGLKTTIDAYTVNGKAISSSPVLAAADINVAEDKTVADAIAALEAAVGEGGSVAAQIQTAIEGLDAEITSTDGTHVTVKVTEVDGKITDVNITESDIASAQDLANLSTLVGTAADNKDAATAFGKAAAAQVAADAAQADVDDVIGKLEAYDPWETYGAPQA